jgi:putative transposase
VVDREVQRRSKASFNYLRPALVASDPRITLHPSYLALSASAPERAAAYRQWLHAPLDEDELTRIRAYMRQQKALGDPRFQAMVAKALNRPVELRASGRPRGTKAVEGVV